MPESLKNFLKASAFEIVFLCGINVILLLSLVHLKQILDEIAGLIKVKSFDLVHTGPFTHLKYFNTDIM